MKNEFQVMKLCVVLKNLANVAGQQTASGRKFLFQDLLGTVTTKRRTELSGL